jgi:hypothetical protein
MRRLGLTIGLALLGTVLTSAASLPSSKAAVSINTVTTCGSFASNPCTNTDKSGHWLPVMSAQIKTSNVADLFAGVSLVTGIYTSTTVKGNSTGSTSTAVAEGTVRVRVLLDPPARDCQSDDCSSVASAPDGSRGVVFDQRIQTLSANLGFIFTGECAASPTTCTLTPEEITLVLDTTAAHSFNFILTNVGVGTHTVVVQAQVSTENTSNLSTTNGGVSVSNALFGLGSLTVDAVRLVNSFNCTADSSGNVVCGN